MSDPLKMRQVCALVDELIETAQGSAQEEIEELERQLVELKEELSRARLQNAIVYGTSHPEIYKTVEDELREQLAEAQVFEALWTGACEVAENDPVQAIYRLREQVTLLRDALTDAVAALEHRWEVVANRAAPIMESVIDAAHTKGVEALAATEH